MSAALRRLLKKCLNPSRELCGGWWLETKTEWCPWLLCHSKQKQTNRKQPKTHLQVIYLVHKQRAFSPQLKNAELHHLPWSYGMSILWTWQQLPTDTILPDITKTKSQDMPFLCLTDVFKMRCYMRLCVCEVLLFILPWFFSLQYLQFIPALRQNFPSFTVCLKPFALEHLTAIEYGDTTAAKMSKRWVWW